MAKKKTKAASNRGYATTSAPSKKIEAPKPVLSTETEQSKTVDSTTVVNEEHPFKDISTEQAAPANIKRVEKEEEVLDPIMRLVKKYESLNEHKAQLALDRLLNEEVQPVPQERVKKFRLAAELEKELLQVIKHKHGDTFDSFDRPLKNSSNEYDKEKIIGQFDILYRILVKLGFDEEDVSGSFEATLSKSIDDHLDWLCVNVPYERMPIGFFDKYFKEDDDDQIVFMPNQSDKDTVKVPAKELETHEKLVITDTTKKTRNAKSTDDDMKSRILQAAQQYMDEEEEEQDINEQYAYTKISLDNLEKLLPNTNKNNTGGKKKGKKGSQVEQQVPTVSLSEEELAKLKKDIKKIKDKLASLEADWDYDKRAAQEFYLKLVKEASEKRRQEEIEARTQLKKQREEQENTSETILEEKEPADSNGGISDDEGGMFGGLMMGEEEEEAVMTSISPSTSTSVSWHILDLDVPKSYVGRFPKDILLDYCNKQKLGKMSFTASNVGPGIWRSAVKIAKEGYGDISLNYELPPGMAASSRQDAEQLVAMYALFEINSSSSTYKVLATSYKTIWTTWVEEKREREEAPRIEADRKRLSYIADLVDKSFDRSTKRKSSIDSKYVEDVTSEAVVKSSKEKVTKQKKMFSKVQNNFKKRLTSENYILMKHKRKDLPIAAYREEILDLVKNNQVLIISGETGCGKSTQVPQFLAEDLLLGCVDGGSVVCTQPRRISAMSIANRVSVEMGDNPRTTGSRDAMVGYQIRLESKVSPENVLLFCTTGILLRRLESDSYLEGVTHVVVDEVHERTIESDFLLVVLKRLSHVRTDLKIILMSATVEASRFSRYFGNCPVVSVPGRTYPVHVQFLEDVIEDTGYVLEEDSPFAVRRARVKTEQGNIQVSGQHGSSKRIHYEMFEEDSDDDDPYDPTHIESKLTIDSSAAADEDDDADTSRKYSRQTRKMIKRMDDKKINYDLILELLDYICIPKKSKTEQDLEGDRAHEMETKGFNIPSTGAILVFLPGMNEIRKIYDLVSSHNVFGDPKKFLLIALHSALSSEHQEKAFDVPPDGIRKIVFSTNIAETGVTISDVTIVIDTGMAKVVSYDDKKRVSRLLQKYIAKANARQRRGRAGRVQEGVCFHLFTQQKFEHDMADYETPEILRLPLEELCLRIKVCGLGSIREVLGAALDAPSQKMIENAIVTLQEVQALSVDGQEQLTPLGAHLANLPVDVHIGKMILFGAIFRCLDPILTIAAALSFKSPFVRPFGKEDEADAARHRFRVGNSDFLTICNAYQAWREHLIDLRQNKATYSSLQRKLHAFCRENFLSEQNLEMIEDMKRQYMGLLVSIGFVKSTDDDYLSQYDVKRGIKLCSVPETYNTNSYSLPVINAALTAGLYPKIAEYLRTSKQIINKDLTLDVHPSSMLFRKEHEFTSDFLVYNTVVMNNANGQMRDKIYMWEASNIDAVAVILLATQMDIKHKQRKMILDNWVHFDCFARTAVLLKFLRKELNNWLAEKMNRPDLDLSQYNKEVMDVIISTLEASTC